MVIEKPRILVVENEAVVGLDIQNQLTRLGFDVPAVVHSGKDAIARTKAWKPDLVLMDLILKGDQTGIEVAQHINGEFDVPIVFLSTHADEETLEDAHESEVYAYLTKPYDEHELRSTIKTSLNRHRLLQQLKQSEARFRGILEIATDAVVSVDADHKITLFNAGAEATFGYSSDEILGKSLSTLLPEDVTKKHVTLMTAFAESDRPVRIMGEGRPVFGRKKNGDLFPAESSISRLDTPDGPVFTAILRDISDRRALEEQLMQSQKMEAFGKLAGGVAHDFNNLLMPILGYCEMLADADPSPETFREAISEIQTAAERASALTRQLLSFSRKSVIQILDVNLNANVRHMEKMLRRLIGTGITFTTDLHPDTGDVRIDPSELEQITLNLVVNARDAVLQNGDISIRTDLIDSQTDKLARQLNLAPGKYAMLAVSDNGAGMDPATQARIFEPFFTTKKLGEGTGLGLSTVYGIVKRNGGEIDIDSTPGQGTCFTIFLPSLRITTTEIREHSKQEEHPVGSETILLVEDEDMVIKVVSRFLEKSGYTVLQAREPSEALELCANREGGIDLLLTDMVMPQMNGRRLAEAVEEARSGIKIIFMSGYREHGEDEPETWDVEQNFIQKPFTSKQLLTKVRTVLDKKE